MNKILLIGGNCPLGRSIIASAPCAIDAPTSAEFDLSDTEQIAEFNFSGYDTLIINARAGGGQRYLFGDWPTELLSYNLDVNIRGITLLLQRWLNHTDSGTVVFTGSDGIRHQA